MQHRFPHGVHLLRRLACPRTSRLFVLVSLVLVLVACKAEKPTQIVVSIDSNLTRPDEIDVLVVKTDWQGKEKSYNEYNLASPKKLPATLTLIAGKDPAEPVLVTVTGKKGKKRVVERKARSPWVPGKILLLRIRLSRSCANLFCEDGADQTCVDGECVGLDVNPRDLPEYTDERAFQPSDGDVEDAGADGGGTTDGQAVDATPPDSATELIPEGYHLFAHYDFSETSGTTVGDSSPNGNDGTGQNIDLAAEGNSGGGAYFDGAGCIRVPDDASLRPENGVAIDLWFKPVSHNKTQRLVAKHGGVNDASYAFIWEPQSGMYFRTEHVGDVEYDQLIVYQELMADQWHRITAIYDGQTKKLYIDEDLVGEKTKTGPIHYTASELTIGCYESIDHETTGQYVKGTVDEVRLYGK